MTDSTFSSYKALRKHLEAQLQPGTVGGVPTRFEAARTAYAEVAAAGDDHSARMKAAAAYGGHMKRWRNLLITHCTHLAMKGRDTSMHTVKHWQKTVFGCSVTFAELLPYAKEGRTAATKLDALTTDDPASIEAQQFYRKHIDLLKAKTNPKGYRAKLD